MGSFYTYKCQWQNCSLKAEALDELLAHVESIHIPKERHIYDDPDRRYGAVDLGLDKSVIILDTSYHFRFSEIPLSCIYNYANGPVQLRYKKSRTYPDKSVRDAFSARIEKECTKEQLHDRFHFDEDDFPTNPPPINEEHQLMKIDIVTQDQRRIKTGILKANTRLQESHKCHCGKSYRSSNALKNHMMTYHAARGSQIATDDS